MDRTTLRARARELLSEERPSLEDLWGLAKDLACEDLFSHARRLLLRARDLAPEGADAPWKTPTDLRQQLALYTSKDRDLPAATRHDDALGILAPDLPSDASTAELTDEEVESLGIAGGMAKRKWEWNARRETLEESLAWYLRGARQTLPEGEQHVVVGHDGYCAINAAYVLDLLAHDVSNDEGAASARAAALRDEADALRRAILDDLGTREGEKNYWQLVTLAEALFGIGEYDDARPYLEAARKLDKNCRWQHETTSRQLAGIARLTLDRDGALPPEAVSVLAAFLGTREEDVLRSHAPKVGLALSGGGFRASLFHLGVLAALAEVDLLRRVEVLSCVSGGSIVGAALYLKLHSLLETTPDEALEPAAYTTLVAELIDAFVAGVQKNPRTSLGFDVADNFRMLLGSESRTERMGRLLEDALYRPLTGSAAPPPLPALKIRPAVRDERDKKDEKTFEPRYDNGKRGSKVPVLILNATSLNTGHNWQFTTSFLGEPPGAIDPHTDANARLRRAYFDDLANNPRTKRYGDFPLARAVAASACVPALFEPIVLQGLYPGRAVRLVDGGVHDNQGVTGLLEQDCGIVLVSDASGQMGSDDDPAQAAAGVALRSNGVLQARVRDAQIRDVTERSRAGLLHGLAVVHLRRGVEEPPVDWLGCTEPTRVEPRSVLTSFGVDRAIQRQLAAVRTDLDAFSEAECYALMVSGHRMMREQLRTSRVAGDTTPAPPQGGWPFEMVARAMDGSDPVAGRWLSERLAASHERFLRWLTPCQRSVLKGTGSVLGVLLVLGLLAAVVWSATAEDVGRVPVLTLGGLLGFLAVTIVAGATARILGPAVADAVFWKRWLVRLFQTILGAALLALIARAEACAVRRWFLAPGQIDRMPR